MSREEAVRIFRKEVECLSHAKCEDCILEKVCDPAITTPLDSEYIEAYGMAIQALSQEPKYWMDNDGKVHKLVPMAQEPCTDTVSIRKDILKCRVGKIVAYNVEWLKKHWQMEMDIVCGVKPCTDAVSRDAVLDETIRKNSIWNSITNSEGKNLEEIIFELPSVTQKSGKWDRLYSWLNDMRLGIAPDETVDDIDERHCRESQTDILDEIMEWMIKAESEEQTE